MSDGYGLSHAPRTQGIKSQMDGLNIDNYKKKSRLFKSLKFTKGKIQNSNIPHYCKLAYKIQPDLGLNPRSPSLFFFKTRR